MIPSDTLLRIARPTRDLGLAKKMYMSGLGFSLLGEFRDHDGFSGIMLGLKGLNYHLEFTHCLDMPRIEMPSPEDLLIFYIPENLLWKRLHNRMQEAGFTPVSPSNPYWAINGKTFEDLDGRRVVLQNSQWMAAKQTY